MGTITTKDGTDIITARFAVAFEEAAPGGCVSLAIPSTPCRRRKTATTIQEGQRHSRRQPTFSPLERQVISLSRTDERHSLSDGLGARLRAWLAGRRVSPLADPHLESLRRLGVLLRVKGFGVRPSEIDRFIAAGFSPDHVDALYSAVTAKGARSARSRRKR